VIFLAFILALFLVSGVYALETTLVYGKVDPLARVSMTATYTNNGEVVEIPVTKLSDATGYWDFKIISDAGKDITMEISCLDVTKTFITQPTGSFEADLGFETPAPPAANDTAPAAAAAPPAAPAPAQNASAGNSTTEDNQAGITGDSFLSLKPLSFGKLSPGWTILIFFVLIVVANLISFLIVFLVIRRMGKTIKVGESSARLRQQEEEKKREEQQRRTEELRKRKVEELKAQIKKIESG